MMRAEGLKDPDPPPARAEKLEVARRHAAYLTSSLPTAETAGLKIGLGAAGLDWALKAMMRDAVVLNAIADDYAE